MSGFLLLVGNFVEDGTVDDSVNKIKNKAFLIINKIMFIIISLTIQKEMQRSNCFYSQ